MYKPQKPRIKLLLSIALLLAVSACVPAAKTATTAADQATSAAPATGAFVPMKFTDSVGREVEIKDPPARIVSLAPSITESLYAIGAGSLLVGRTDFCDYPQEALALPSVGGFDSSTISIETIVALDPDLVIGGSIYQADLAESLAKAGIPVFIMEPRTVEEIMDSLQTLGRVTNHAADADTLVAGMQSRIDAVAQVVNGIPQAERPTVFYEVWADPYMTTSNQTYIGELIKMAGGVNIFADLKEDYPTISAEEIIARDPRVILGPSNHADQLTGEAIMAREGWSNIAAVKSDRIYIVDGNIVSRTGPRVVDALEDIIRDLYPDKFGGSK
jgi:iron complex transport system substrate-binding protein